MQDPEIDKIEQEEAEKGIQPYPIEDLAPEPAVDPALDVEPQEPERPPEKEEQEVHPALDTRVSIRHQRAWERGQQRRRRLGRAPLKPLPQTFHFGGQETSIPEAEDEAADKEAEEKPDDKLVPIAPPPPGYHARGSYWNQSPQEDSGQSGGDTNELVERIRELLTDQTEAIIQQMEPLVQRLEEAIAENKGYGP